MIRMAISPRFAIKILENIGSLLYDCERKLCADTKLSIHISLSFCKNEGVAGFEDPAFTLESVAGPHRAAEFDIVQAGKVWRRTGVLLRKQDSGGLRHHFTENHAGHDRISREMPL